MKTLFTSGLFSLAIFLSLNSRAQTSFNYFFASNWSSAFCPLPATMYVDFTGSVVGYDDLTEDITMQIFWGDGTDTTFISDLVDAGPEDIFALDSAGAYITHNYYLPGTYTPMLIATGPDGNADTIFGNPLTYTANCVSVDGYTYEDNNSNCIFDAGDDTIPWVQVQIYDSGGILISMAYSDSNGYYNFTVPDGLTSLFIGATYGSLITTCPVAGGYTFNSTSSVSFDLGLICSTTLVDYYASHSGMCGIGVPGGTGAMAIAAGMYGCSSSNNATITLTLDPLVSYTSMISGPAPTTVVGNVLTWDVVLPNGGYGYGFVVQLNTFTSTSAVIGAPSCWNINITGVGTDSDLSNNNEYHCLTVGGPWDPNAKEVVPAGVGVTGNVAPETEFYYTLYFQNTGTAPAINIYVMDTISNNLDMETFQILGSSHNMNPIFTGLNIVRFDFPNINLPDSNANEQMSHGWVKYRINAKSGLPDGTEITNTGHIFFDYNSAIVTNTTLNTIDYSLGIDEPVDGSINNLLFPNPATNVVTVQFENPVSGTLILVDAMGKEVMRLIVNNEAEIEIPLGDLPSGLYVLNMPGVELKQNRLQIIK